MRSELEKEMGKILGGLVSYENGTVRAAQGLGDMRFQGVFSAAGILDLFGLFKRKRSFRITRKQIEPVRDAFLKLGTPVTLENAPDARAVMCPSYLFNTAILTLEEDSRNFDITYYAHRNLLNGLNFKRQIKRMEKKAGGVELKEKEND